MFIQFSIMLFFNNKDQNIDKKLSKTNTLKSDGYIILGHIANGSYGEVRHAKHKDNELNLVVKMIDTNQTSKEYVSKFLPRELDIIRKINHPYIIHTHSILQKRTILYIFMAYADKGDLLNYIINQGPIKESHARIWFRQIVLAVQYLHAMDIVHRDIKCENILITENLTLKLTDFGFSKFIKRGQRLNCITHCCSVGYAAPEVLRHSAYDGMLSDIWSLGVVLYVMLNKKMPFSSKSIKFIYKQQIKRDWKHEPLIEKMISENVKTCIDNILQPEPGKRWKIHTILDSNWIKMNQMLVKMNEQESLALLEALSTNKTVKQKQLKKIEANRSETQQILNDQMPRFFSISQNVKSLSDIDEENSYTDTSKYKLRRSQRIMHTGYHEVSNSNIT